MVAFTQLPLVNYLLNPAAGGPWQEQTALIARIDGNHDDVNGPLQPAAMDERALLPPVLDTDPNAHRPSASDTDSDVVNGYRDPLEGRDGDETSVSDQYAVSIQIVRRAIPLDDDQETATTTFRLTLVDEGEASSEFEFSALANVSGAALNLATVYARERLAVGETAEQVVLELGGYIPNVLASLVAGEAVEDVLTGLNSLQGQTDTSLVDSAS